METEVHLRLRRQSGASRLDKKGRFDPRVGRSEYLRSMRADGLPNPRCTNQDPNDDSTRTGRYAASSRRLLTLLESQVKNIGITHDTHRTALLG